MGNALRAEEVFIPILTKLQRRVLEQIAAGKRDATIAEMLDTTEASIRTMVFRLLNSTGTGTRGGLVAWALRHKVIE